MLLNLDLYISTFTFVQYMLSLFSDFTLNQPVNVFTEVKNNQQCEL